MTVASHHDETLLLQQLRDGSERAFELLYQRHAKPILWKLRRMVKDPDEADELLQNLFVKIWEKREQIVINQTFDAYLYRVAQRMAVDYFRSLARQSKLYEQAQSEMTEVIDNTQELLEAKETQQLLNNAISLLPEQRRRAFTLCKIEGKSHQEAARIMEISPNTVHNHLVKAVGFVKDYMEKSGQVLSPMALLILLYAP